MTDITKSGIPIISLTANAFDEDKKKAFEAGITRHLAKPTEISKSVETLSSIIKA